MAHSSLPVSQYADVVPRTIVVRAAYPGANAQGVARTVATPIEREAARIRQVQREGS